MAGPTLKVYVPGATPALDPTVFDGGVPLVDGTADVAPGAAVVAFVVPPFAAVAFAVDGAWAKAEASPPLSCGGDAGGRVLGVDALREAGPHVVRAVACRTIAESNDVLAGKHVVGVEEAVARFWVGPRPAAPRLEAYADGADAGKAKPLRVLTAGVEIPAYCAIVARPAKGPGAVAFRLDGADDADRARVQAGAPFTFPEDAKGVVNGSPHLTPGPHALEAWACADADAARRALGGAELPHAVVAFTCAAPPPPPRMVGPDGWRRPADAEGYALPPDLPDAVYVSSGAGDDANRGSLASPVRTLRAAFARLRAEPGRRGVLLRRGDAFDEALRTDDAPLAGTREAPLCIGAYGDPAAPRPRLLRDVGSDLRGLAGWRWLVVQSLAFEPPKWADRGLRLLDGGGFWVEDCRWRNVARPAAIKGSTGWVFRRNVVTDAYHPNMTDGSDLALKSIGLYAERCDGFLWLEGNAFDRVGFRPPVQKRSQYNQAVYVQSDCGPGLVAEGNLFSTISSHGLQARTGGVVRFNLFRDCATGLSLGLVNGGHAPVAGGVRGAVARNHFTLSRNQAIEVDNVVALGVERNAFRGGKTAVHAHPSLANVLPNGRRPEHPSVGVRDALVRNNRSRDGGGVRVTGDAKRFKLRLDANQFDEPGVPDLPPDLVERARAMGPGRFVDFRAVAERLT